MWAVIAQHDCLRRNYAARNKKEYDCIRIGKNGTSILPMCKTPDLGIITL